MIDRIVTGFKPRKIILFGSSVCGTFGPDSDIDLLIVMDVEKTTRQKANEIDCAMIDRRIPMDFLVLTPEQYEQQKQIYGAIACQAHRQGKVVYEYAA